MPLRRTDLKPTSRRGGRVKAEAAEGGGATAPALTRPSRPRNNPPVSLRLTAKTVALPLRERAGVRGSCRASNFALGGTRPSQHGPASVLITAHAHSSAPHVLGPKPHSHHPRGDPPQHRK